MTTETKSPDRKGPDRIAPDRNLLAQWTPLIVAVVVAGVVVIGITARRESRRDRQAADLSDSFVYDVERYKVIPPERIGYREVAKFETGFIGASAIAVGPQDEIIVGGDGGLRVYLEDGLLLAEIPMEEAPVALAIAPPGILLAASKSRVFLGAILGPIEEIFQIPGGRTRITSLAADREFVYVADYGSRGVWRYTLSGEPCGRIGDRNAAFDIPGFAVPSPYFDLLLAPDGLLRIVDPGRHKIMAFTTVGNLEVSWGKPTFALEGFSGCCNPSHIAVLPDGRFVTSEKGIPRVKVHDVDGEFVTAVVGCSDLDTETDPCDVAVDSRGRILVLDPGRGRVRIFTPFGRSDDGE